MLQKLIISLFTLTIAFILWQTSKDAVVPWELVEDFEATITELEQEQPYYEGYVNTGYSKGQTSVIVGGRNNVASGSYSVIVGGSTNTVVRDD